MSVAENGDPTRVEGAEPPTRTPAVPAAMNDSGHAAGSNTAAPSGAETERDAPGTSKDDRADGLR